MKIHFSYFFFFFLLLLIASMSAPYAPIAISKQEAQEIGLKIWNNECRGTIEGLTSWNKGEKFASMGIGHFIWYPEDASLEFQQTFPSLLLFLEKNGKKIPAGILKKGSLACPWKTREEFLHACNSAALKKLQRYLVETIDLQIQFLVERLHKALERMLKNLSSAQKKHVTRQFYRVAKSPGGKYALVDYLNFKGEGVMPNVSYQGYRWGLLQVLLHMKGTSIDKMALEEFATVAKQILKARIDHAPQAAKAVEQQWLAGWVNRLNTYLL